MKNRIGPRVSETGSNKLTPIQGWHNRNVQKQPKDLTPLSASKTHTFSTIPQTIHTIDDMWKMCEMCERDDETETEIGIGCMFRTNIEALFEWNTILRAKHKEHSQNQVRSRSSPVGRTSHSHRCPCSSAPVGGDRHHSNLNIHGLEQASPNYGPLNNTREAFRFFFLFSLFSLALGEITLWQDGRRGRGGARS